MTTGTLLFAVAMLLLAGIFVAKPLLEPQKRVVQTSERKSLLAQKEALLTELEALEFDFESGKLPEQMYVRERFELVEETADILRQLDILKDTDNRDKAIETAIMEIRNANKVACTACAKLIDKEANFCSFCGESQ